MAACQLHESVRAGEVQCRDAHVTSRIVDVNIRWLRVRIEEPPLQPRRIQTVRGGGCKFVG